MMGRRRGSDIGRQIMPVAAAAVLLVGLSGCDQAPPDQDPEQNPSPVESQSAGADADTGEDTASGPVELASPIEFLLVEEVGEAPCAEGFVAAPENEECLRLGDGMEITEVIELELGAEVTQEGTETGAPLVNLTMIEEDGAAFADLTTEALTTDSMRVAMVVDGEAVAAPQVAQEIYGGQVQITSWDDAEEFVAEATGG